MKEKLKPMYIYDKIEDIPLKIFEDNNILGIIFDADNTIIAYKRKLSQPKKDWIDSLKHRGYKMCILSNTFNERKIRSLMTELDINGLCYAMKPALKGFKMALNLLDVKKENAIIIGDQLFTDIYGANRFGIKSIFVKPLSKKEDPITMLKRPLENCILKSFIKEKKEK